MLGSNSPFSVDVEAAKDKVKREVRNFIGLSEEYIKTSVFSHDEIGLVYEFTFKEIDETSAKALCDQLISHLQQNEFRYSPKIPNCIHINGTGLETLAKKFRGTQAKISHSSSSSSSPYNMRALNPPVLKREENKYHSPNSKGVKDSSSLQPQPPGHVSPHSSSSSSSSSLSSSRSSWPASSQQPLPNYSFSQKGIRIIGDSKGERAPYVYITQHLINEPTGIRMRENVSGNEEICILTFSSKELAEINFLHLCVFAKEDPEKASDTFALDKNNVTITAMGLTYLKYHKELKNMLAPSSPRTLRQK